MSDQICLNLNVGLRSLTQAAMVLVFMFKASWRLTIITFILIPIIILVCKVYGAYYRCAGNTLLRLRGRLATLRGMRLL